jgi:hypothetical protein
VDVERLTGGRQAAALGNNGSMRVPAAQSGRREAAGLPDLAEIFDSDAAAASLLTRVG